MADMPQTDHPFVSVIIPAYNDAARIKLCVDALLAQTYPRDRYEIIVIDNGSRDGTPDMVRSFPVTLLIEPQTGSYAARNTGLAQARGSIVAFTDSDCVPQSDWIEQGVARLQATPNCGLLAGRIKIFFQHPQRPTMIELYESVYAFQQRRFIERDHFGATANVFTYRSVLDKVGHFNSSLKSSGDREWGNRVHAAGYTLSYADEPCVLHPARASFGEVYTKVKRVMIGMQAVKGARAYAWSKFVKGLVRDLIAPWKEVRKIRSAPQLTTPSQRFKVFCVLVVISLMQTWTRIRLQITRPPVTQPAASAVTSTGGSTSRSA